MANDFDDAFMADDSDDAVWADASEPSRDADTHWAKLQEEFTTVRSLCLLSLCYF
jgi:hypothetical protein